MNACLPILSPKPMPMLAPHESLKNYYPFFIPKSSSLTSVFTFPKML